MLLLKGISIEEWLYDAGEVRPSSDVDVLVRPDDFADAECVLRGLGFTNRYDGASPHWAEEHADAWVHGEWPLPVDLHRHVWGMGTPPDRAWLELVAGAEGIEMAGEIVAVLREDARLVLLVLHATHHGARAPRPVAEVRRAIDRIADPVWRAATDTARRLRAERSFAAGLRLAPGSDALLERLGLAAVEPAPASRFLPIWNAPPTTEGFVRLRLASSWTERFEILRREVLPSAVFMRSRSPQSGIARRGRLGLLVAYPVRWGQLLLNGRRGWRASRAPDAPHRR